MIKRIAIQQIKRGCENYFYSKWYFLYRFLVLFVFISCGNLDAQTLRVLPESASKKTIQNTLSSATNQQETPVTMDDGQSLRGSGLGFTENKGQFINVDGKPVPDVLFKGGGNSMDVYIRNTGISYVLSNYFEAIHEVSEMAEELGHSEDSFDNGIEEKLLQELMKDKVFTIQRLDFDFVNCNKTTSFIKESKVEGVKNYYYPHCPNGILNVLSYNEVSVQNIYKNIDVNYFGDKNKGLKYDIVIKPGGDYKAIKIKYSGHEKLNTLNGALQIGTAFGDIKELMPKVYQNINDQIIQIEANYVIEGKEEETIVSFKLGKYNPDYAVIIDPWVTYFGGAGSDHGNGITNDDIGNVLVTGTTSSLNMPVQVGSFQNSLKINWGSSNPLLVSQDLYVMKMSDQSTLLWCTYYGGTNSDYGRSVACDAGNNVYVTGNTISTDFPTGALAGNNAHDNTFGGGGSNGAWGDGGDAFVIKFNSVGVRQWATYYGGELADTGWDIITDGINMYAFGQTASMTAISTAGAFSAVNTGADRSAFIVKFLPNGLRSWCTYLGGNNADFSGRIAYDKVSGNLYVAGVTYSSNFPVFAGHDMTYGGGGDNYLFKFDQAGNRIWATYYGGNNAEGLVTHPKTAAVACDDLGNVYLTSISYSTTGITTVGSYKQAFSGPAFEAYLAKFNSAGTRQWGTYFSSDGTRSFIPIDIVTDKYRNCYIFGEYEDSNAGTYPISSCAYQPIYATPGVSAGSSGEDQEIFKFNAAGILTCWTFLGGTLEDDAESNGGMSLFANNLYLTASTNGNYPVTANAYQTTFGGGTGSYGGGDAYVAQLCLNICEGKILALDFAAVQNKICPNIPIKFTPSVNNSCDTSGYRFQWYFPGGTPSSSTAVSPTVSYPVSGNNTVKLVLTTTCKKDSVSKIIPACTCVLGSSIKLNSDASCFGSKLGSATVTVINGSGGPYTYSWSNGVTTQTATNLAAGTYSVVVSEGSCSVSSFINIVDKSPTVTLAVNGIACQLVGSAAVTVSSGTGPYSYMWSDGRTGSSVSGFDKGSYTVTVSDATGCTKEKSFTIKGDNVLSASFDVLPNSNVCIGSKVDFKHTSNDSVSEGYKGKIEWLISPSNVSGSSPDFSYTFLSAGTYEIKHKVNGNISGSSCWAEITKVVKVINCAQPSVIATGNNTCIGGCTIITTNSSGGVQPYTYSWSSGATTQNINPCPVSTITYTVTIKDMVGNTSTSTAVVTVNPIVNVSTTVSNLTCNGVTNGSATANASNGTPNYTYNWSNGLGSGFQVSGLSAGTYTVTITDNKGCTGTSIAAIISPPVLVGKFTKGTAMCTGCGCKEWVLVNASGGTSPYSYFWPDGYLNRYKNQLCPGSYNVNIIDKNGCSININLTAP